LLCSIRDWSYLDGSSVSFDVAKSSRGLNIIGTENDMDDSDVGILYVTIRDGGRDTNIDGFVVNRNEGWWDCDVDDDDEDGVVWDKSFILDWLFISTYNLEVNSLAI
jgi:hypothetical protein